VTVPGPNGTVVETLLHLVDAEASYLYRLTGEWPSNPWREDYAVGIEVLIERASVLSATLERFLAGEWDDERLDQRWSDDEVFTVRAGVFLAQTLHHANEHRAHVCTILGALGIEPPDVSAWGYARATGRMSRSPRQSTREDELPFSN
jgi:uncharacterized damage-inducible protein DinB